MKADPAMPAAMLSVLTIAVSSQKLSVWISAMKPNSRLVAITASAAVISAGRTPIRATTKPPNRAPPIAANRPNSLVALAMSVLEKPRSI